MKYNNLIKSILAGISISLAGVAYLTVDNSIIGSLLFSIGLLTIYLFNWNLYTGKCCFIPINIKTYLPISIFILAKFEHVVANMFYISLANLWNVETIVFILICGFGNMLGCCIIPFLNSKVEN